MCIFLIKLIKKFSKFSEAEFKHAKVTTPAGATQLLYIQKILMPALHVRRSMLVTVELMNRPHAALTAPEDSSNRLLKRISPCDPKVNRCFGPIRAINSCGQTSPNDQFILYSQGLTFKLSPLISYGLGGGYGASNLKKILTTKLNERSFADCLVFSNKA